MSIYLYLKTHNVTGLKYLGQTKKDPFVYRGSGKHWMRHIKKHGYDVTTTVLYETPFIEEIQEQGLYFSDIWNIVDSKEFANLKPESGDGSFGNIHTDETRRKISESKRGRLGTENGFFGKSHSDVSKLKMSEIKKGKIPSEETRRKMSEAHKGRMVSDETRRKMSEWQKGRKLSEEHKRKMSESNKGRTASEETRRKISESQKGKKGRTASEETRRKISESQKGIPQQKTTCPHCGKIGGSRSMTRWHFDNCKHQS